MKQQQQNGLQDSNDVAEREGAGQPALSRCSRRAVRASQAVHHDTQGPEPRDKRLILQRVYCASAPSHVLNPVSSMQLFVPPVKGTVGGHGPVGLDLAGQVPQNCETVQGFKANGLRQEKGFNGLVSHSLGRYWYLPVTSQFKYPKSFRRFAIYSATLSLCSSAWQTMSSQMDDDGAKQCSL